MSEDKTYCKICRCTVTTHTDINLCDECFKEALLRDRGVYLGAYDRDDGKIEHLTAFPCEKCGGSGHVYMSSRTIDTDCFTCEGTGYITRSPEEVQRTARWWQTYQQNRQPAS